MSGGSNVRPVPLAAGLVGQLANLLDALPARANGGDEVDRAQAIADEHLRLSLATIRADIPVGVAGECDDCGEDMPRLVGGRCGYCRDGRRRPGGALARRAVLAPRGRADDELAADIARVIEIARRPAPTPPAPQAPTMRAAPADAPVLPSPGEDDAMTLQADVRNITVQARGELRETIERLAEEMDTALGQVGRVLIEEALAARSAAPAVTPAVVDLATVPVEWLTEEIGRRLAESASSAERDAAIARAEAAEGQLATVRAHVAQMMGVVG